MNSELNEVRRHIEERDAQNGAILRGKNSLTQTNEELRRNLEEETKAKTALAHTLHVRLMSDIIRIFYLL